MMRGGTLALLADRVNYISSSYLSGSSAGVPARTDRMPVILSEESAGTWLNLTAGDAELKMLLTSYPESEMHATPITTLINSVANEGAEVAVPAQDSV
jgi:putative SOS response-associated peptidase YedK